MKFSPRHTLLAILALTCLTSAVLADEFLEGLQPDQSVHGFRTVNLYDNNSGQAVGARFISEKNGFVIDLLQIQSVPQAFYWIKTPINASRGEPHACEHLLLGKGNRGRYVSALEDMALGNSTAYTGQYRTCYHFNTTAGDETFYEIFEAKLQALLHPDFSDEEIQREVCHIGVVADPRDGSLSLEEKGTVYTEMVSSFERPYYNTYRKLYQLVYGEDHPLTHCSGGDPDVMRSMVPQDMWDFHSATHHLANMGSIVSLPSSVPVESFLQQMSETLDHCQDWPDSSALTGIGVYDFPPPNPAPIGTSQLVKYPSDRAESPGYLLYSWPADLELDFKESAVLDLFLEAFGSGETSDLYDLFINSETRQIELGATAVDGWIEDELGNPISFDLTGVTSSLVDRKILDSVGAMIVSAARRVHDYADGSAELKEFNTRSRNRLIEYRKSMENHLNQPPMFGFRSGSAGAWLSKMDDLEDVPGFRKSLVFDETFNYVDSLLALDHNIWTERIDAWHLLTVPPFAIGATPSAEIIKANTEAKAARLDGYLANFKAKYGVDDDQAAIAAYKAEFDAKTAELEASRSKDDLPGFIDNPPMTLDDQLDYETVTLPGDVPLVASTFDNMSSSRVGLALRLDVIPESLMVYVPFLASVMTEIGVVKDGEVIAYDDMQERLRQEVLNFNAYNSYGLPQGRVELVLAGEGTNRQELLNALDWMTAALYSSYLSVDNLARMRDRADQLVERERNRVRGSEESWVRTPATAYQYQENPLILSASCFFTRAHHLQRLRWRLTDPGDETARTQLAAFFDALEASGAGLSREELGETLRILKTLAVDPATTAETDLGRQLRALSAPGAAIAKDVLVALKSDLDDIPDANLADDWSYLCRSTRDDILFAPAVALAQLKEIVGLISRADNARMFMISNRADRDAAVEAIGRLVGGLSGETSVRQQYDPRPRIVERLATRETGLDRPVYVGLVHEGTQNGVLVFNARVADGYDTTGNALLNCLSGKLFDGGGPHGLFMKTWAAGLAYSNGYGYGEGTGRAAYYAERCPDVAETMRFVVNELKTAETDPGLVDYAIAQVFGISRAPSRYEQRGEAMAADLTDGITPERVRTFREKVLQTRDREGLFEDLVARMEAAYGPVLIGYGDPLTSSEDGNFFLIGPEPQFESLENYIESVEGAQTIYRLYPRDFWLTI